MYEDFIAKRVYDLRVNKNVSARDMSLSIGQNSNYINQIERKKMLPSMQGFYYICEFFDISPKEFFNIEKSTTSAQEKAIEHIYNMNADDINAFLYIVERCHKSE